MHGELFLGTAQLASPYGSVKQVMPPSLDDAVSLVRTAIDRGVVTIDTARAYTGSEEALGAALDGVNHPNLRVITKLDPLGSIPDDAPAEQAVEAAEASVRTSLSTLGSHIVPVMMVHRAKHIHGWNGQVWSHLKRLVQDDVIRSLGVSIQNVEEAFLSIRTPEVSVIQLPVNVLDHRWEDAEVTAELLRDRPDIEVHARSVFLQGIFLREPDAWPKIEAINAEEILAVLNQAVIDYGRDSVADLCLAWIRSQAWVRGIVVGMEQMAQLEDNLKLFSRPPLSAEEAVSFRELLPRVPEQLLNPALWPPVAGA